MSVTERENAREAEGVMVFCSKVHWPLCRMILIDSDGHFLGDSVRDSMYVCECVYYVLICVALCTASVI